MKHGAPSEQLSHSIYNFSVNLLLRPCYELGFHHVKDGAYTSCRQQTKKGVETGYMADLDPDYACHKVTNHHGAPKGKDGQPYGGPGSCWQREIHGGPRVQEIPNPDE